MIALIFGMSALIIVNSTWIVALIGVFRSDTEEERVQSGKKVGTVGLDDMK